MAEQSSQHPEASRGAPSDAGDETVHHVPARKKRGAAPARMQLNLTAMIDVTFQLLIYFVVTANFAFEEGMLTARMPEGRGQTSEQTLEPLPTDPLNIDLQDVGVAGASITVAGERVNDFSALSERLDQLQASGVYPADNPVKVRPTSDVRYQHVLNAFNAAVAQRFENVSISEVQEQ